MEKSKKRIFILLPRPRSQVAGGYKVVYQYANLLSEYGYNVTIGYDCLEVGNKYRIQNKYLKKIIGIYLLKKFKWFDLKNVYQLIISSIGDIKKTNFDIYIATAVNTIDHLIEGVEDTSKVTYFIQGLETWMKEYDPFKTFSYPVNKIVISNWLSQLVSRYSKENQIYLCQNGIDHEIFNVSNPIELRENVSVCFLFHKDLTKGPDILEGTIKGLKYKYKNLKIYSFGAFEKPEFLNENDIYIQNASPSQVSELYNSSSVFLSTSREEGFGLTGLEAMACGCALVTTKTNGAMEYANVSNSILCNNGKIDELIAGVCTLFSNKELRINIAQNGYESATKFNKEVSNLNFIKAIDSILEEN